MKLLTARISIREVRTLGVESQFAENDPSFDELLSSDWPMPPVRSFADIEREANEEARSILRSTN